jgi:hypothetical protein
MNARELDRMATLPLRHQGGNLDSLHHGHNEATQMSAQHYNQDEAESATLV